MPAFNAITARHWRVRVTANNGSLYLGIGVFLVCDGVDIDTTGKTYSASSVPLGPPYTAAAAWDMVVNGQGYWATGVGALPAWIAVDMGVPVAVDRVDISISTSANLTESPRDFTIEYSQNGTDWTVASRQADLTNDTGWALGARRQFEVGTPLLNLVFSQGPATADLVFGESEGAVLINSARVELGLPGLGFAASLPGFTQDITLLAGMPALGFVAGADSGVITTLEAGMPGLGFDASGSLDLNVSRPLVASTVSSYQTAVPTESGAETRHSTGQMTRGFVETHHTPALQTVVGVQARTQDALPLGAVNNEARHSEAMRVPANGVRQRHGDALRGARNVTRARHDNAVPIRSSVWTDWQERYRDRRPTLRSRYQEATGLRVSRRDRAQTGKPVQLGRSGAYQEAMRPPAGRYTPPIVVPPSDPCYTPSPHLLYSEGPGNSHLLFICENHDTPELPPGQVVVPVRKVYVVLNDVFLKRVAGNIDLLALDLSMSLDADSWSWSWSARLPLRSEDEVMPSAGEPVEVEASINGTAYRLLVENVSRERSFGAASIRVSGRGKSALLAAPYAPVMTFSNDIARTAQQLMDDALLLNGVPLGWDVNWQLTDWLVPADVFNVRGSHMDALNSIVGAVGGYIQPHPTAQTLLALPRYPVKPWEWAGATPDFELPAALTTREGIEWQNNPEYNRVFVSGQGAGVLGRVTRAGTAGDLAAPMVVDPLITHADAARQRGLAILGAAGSKANVNLTLPVLPATGVIQPGKMVRYVDGATTRIGLVRSTSVNASMPTLRQTLVLETQP
jgi:hypothetical protein